MFTKDYFPFTSEAICANFKVNTVTYMGTRRIVPWKILPPQQIPPMENYHSENCSPKNSLLR